MVRSCKVGRMPASVPESWEHYAYNSYLWETVRYSLSVSNMYCRGIKASLKRATYSCTLLDCNGIAIS